MGEKVVWSYSAAIASVNRIMVDDDGDTWGVLLRQKVDSKGNGVDLFAVEIFGVEKNGSTPCFGEEKRDIQGLSDAVTTFNAFVKSLGGKSSHHISTDQFERGKQNRWHFNASDTEDV